MAHATPPRRLVVLALLGALPWSAVVVGDGVTLLSPFGFYDVPSDHLLWVWDLLRLGGGLPRDGRLLPLTAALYVLAIASAALGLADREDPRLTAGLLVLAGVAHLGVAASFAHRLRYTPVPLAVVLTFAVAWWFYWPDLRALALAPVSPEE